MAQVSFWTPVEMPLQPQDNSIKKLLKSGALLADRYVYLGSKELSVLDGALVSNENKSYIMTAVKILSYFILFVPLKYYGTQALALPLAPMAIKVIYKYGYVIPQLKAIKEQKTKSEDSLTKTETTVSKEVETCKSLETVTIGEKTETQTEVEISTPVKKWKRWDDSSDDKIIVSDLLSNTTLDSLINQRFKEKIEAKYKFLETLQKRFIKDMETFFGLLTWKTNEITFEYLPITPSCRFTNIRPLKDSVLHVGSALLNANLILSSDEMKYIAGQTPQPVSLGPFWYSCKKAAVVEGKDGKEYAGIRMILDLTNQKDETRADCPSVVYYPKADNPIECTYEGKNIKVSCKFKERKDEKDPLIEDVDIFTCKPNEEVPEKPIEIRTHTYFVDFQDGSPVKELIRMNFTGWPDYGAPSLINLELISIIFRRKLKEMGYFEQELSRFYPMVMCRAGVGRTGTFISADTILNNKEIIKELEKVADSIISAGAFDKKEEEERVIEEIREIVDSMILKYRALRHENFVQTDAQHSILLQLALAIVKNKLLAS